MIGQPPAIAPPRIARWLISLFTMDEHSEAIAGDLLEEFGEISRTSGTARARLWYCRQSIKTAWHLALAGFRSAPWSVSALAIASYFLLFYASGLPDRVATAYIASRPVIPYVDPAGPVWLLIRLCGIVVMPTIASRDDFSCRCAPSSRSQKQTKRKYHYSGTVDVFFRTRYPCLFFLKT